MLNDWIYSHPAWLSMGLFILAGIIVSGIMVAVTTRLVGAGTRDSHNEWTSFTITNIGVLYAVLLAFIAVAVWEDFSKASDLVETEAGVVHDLFVDANGLSNKAVVQEIHRKLQRYVHVVVGEEWPRMQVGDVPRPRSPALADVRATLATFQPQTAGDSIVLQEMLHQLNLLYEARRSRLDAATGHIPAPVWGVIILLGLLIVGLTSVLSMSNRWMHFLLAASLTTAIVAVIALIVQFEYPFRGEVSVGAEPFHASIASVEPD
jgi:Protein of unknown function (DUF4239)